MLTPNHALHRPDWSRRSSGKNNNQFEHEDGGGSAKNLLASVATFKNSPIYPKFRFWDSPILVLTCQEIQLRLWVDAGEVSFVIDTVLLGLRPTPISRHQIAMTAVWLPPVVLIALELRIGCGKGHILKISLGTCFLCKPFNITSRRWHEQSSISQREAVRVTSVISGVLQILFQRNFA